MAFPQTASPTLYTGETNSHPVPMPATVNAGDLLLTFFGIGNTVTITTPADWTPLHETLRLGLFRCASYYKIAVGDEDSTTVTYALSGSAKAAAHTYRVTAWDGTIPPEVGAASQGAGTTADPPDLVPSWGAADTLWFALMWVNAGVGISDWPDNYIDNQGNGLGGANGIVTASTRRELNAASEDPTTFTFSSAPWIAQTLAIPPTGAAPPPPPPSPSTGGNRMGGTGAIRKPPRHR